MKIISVVILGIFLLYALYEYIIDELKIWIVVLIIGISLESWFIADLSEHPTIEQVNDGSAVIIETTHITNGDTTKTYEIKWKDGRL